MFPQKMTKNLLVTLSDKNYLQQAKQLFSSVHFNAGWKGDYMLLACEVPESELKWFREKRILVKSVKPLFYADLGDETSPYPPTVTCKLLLFSEEFKNWSTVVFIDSDCIVRYPLESLAKTKGFAATRDWCGTIRGQIRELDGMSESKHAQLFNDYNLTATAFNVGVVAFNTRIINNNTLATLQQIAQKYRRVARYPEQLWMNLYFYKRWEMLPIEYNLYASFLHTKLGVPNKRLDGVVLHFPRVEGKEGFRCWDRNNAFYDEWKRNLERAELIDFEHIPKPNRRWPGLRDHLLRKWRLVRLKLDRRVCLNLLRNKMRVRSRLRGFISTLRRSVLTGTICGDRITSSTKRKAKTVSQNREPRTG
jgi:lipopolysaccharide biosynthesis glycosyltransferase